MSRGEILLDVKKNQVSMMQSRGFDVSDELFIFNLNEEQFYHYYEKKTKEFGISFKNSLNKNYIKREILTNSSNSDISEHYVYFFENPPGDKKSLGINQIDAMLKFFRKMPVKNIILISEKDFHSGAKIEIEKNKDKNFQHFLYTELLVDIKQHIYVPKHKILNAVEVKELKDGARFKFTNSKLPTFKIDDLMIKYIGAREGDFIEVERDNSLLPTIAEKSIFYGIVTSKNTDSSKNLEIQEEE